MTWCSYNSVLARFPLRLCAWHDSICLPGAAEIACVCVSTRSVHTHAGTHRHGEQAQEAVSAVRCENPPLLAGSQGTGGTGTETCPPKW